jgi:hypothetical protein
MKTNTELLCLCLGWQGGTVHQVAQATGLTVSQIIDTNRHLSSIDGVPTAGGWFAMRTCSPEYRVARLFPENQGNLAFWMGCAQGMDTTLMLKAQNTDLVPA